MLRILASNVGEAWLQGLCGGAAHGARRVADPAVASSASSLSSFLGHGGGMSPITCLKCDKFCVIL